MTTNIPTWLPAFEKWEQSDYDGIKGFPPEWVPLPHKKKFYSARFQIFNEVNDKAADYQEIKSRFDALVANNRHAIVLALMSDAKYYDNALSVLVELFKAVSLGEIEGLRALGGDMAAQGAKSKNGYKTRADQVDKADFQKLAMPLLEKNSNIIDKTLNEKDLAPYVRKWPRGVRGWLIEIRPEGKKQLGRPKKT